MGFSGVLLLLRGLEGTGKSGQVPACRGAQAGGQASTPWVSTLPVNTCGGCWEGVTLPLFPNPAPGPRTPRSLCPFLSEDWHGLDGNRESWLRTHTCMRVHTTRAHAPHRHTRTHTQAPHEHVQAPRPNGHTHTHTHAYHTGTDTHTQFQGEELESILSQKKVLNILSLSSIFCIFKNHFQNFWTGFSKFKIFPPDLISWHNT